MQKQKQTTTILLTTILLTTTITTAQNFPTTPEIETGKEYRLPITHPDITLQLLATDSNHRQATIRHTIHTQDGFYTYYDDTKHTNTPFTNTNPEGTLRDGLNDALEDPTTGNPRPWDINNPDLDQLEPVAWPRDGTDNAYILLVWENKNRGIVRYPLEDGYDYPNQDYYNIGDYFRPTWIGRIADGYDNGTDITPPGPGIPPEAVALAHEMQMLGSGRDMPLLVSTLTQNEEILLRAKVLNSQDVTIETETPSNITFSDRPATLGTTIYRNIELGEFWGVAYAINLQNYATGRNGASTGENIKILGEEYEITNIDPVNAEITLQHPTKGLITLQDNQPAPTSLVAGPGAWTVELDFVDNKLSWLVLHSLAGTTRNLDQNPVEGPWMNNGDPYFVISAKDFTTQDPTAKIYASMTQTFDVTLSEGRSIVLPMYGDLSATITLDSVMGSSAVLRWEISGDDYFKIREVEDNVDLYNIQDENIWPWVNITVDGQFELIWETEPNPNTVRIFSENRQDNPDPTPDLVRKVGDQ
ncbi:MAG: hypothetical protein DRO11_09825 [Methanobacteriota archaeon]|nr:MAG: hypothetical protein DRO11_09825 [Euryarchaeota archaeon]